MSSNYEEQKRQQKASDIAYHLHSQGVTSDDLDTMHPQELANHVIKAGHDHASGETMDMVRKGMKVWDQPKLDDPFAGL